ncbi:Chaperone protein HtpG [Buchnera aphidicola (Myzocallis carpini)]|uniref:molecular chaperone HtpG n=1 Tax=Buchnera aphidicola TaxID=9 RepID=UPI003A617FE8
MPKKEKYQFQSETKQILDLMIHSLYSNKEIFIRELISNASDAIEKIRFQLLSQKNNTIQNMKMKIRISINKQSNTLMISDNGIGMTKDEIIQNLGTIANSGTKKFLHSINSKKLKNNELIGKFGVGFYSSFIVSEKVIVKTRHHTELEPNNSILWESDGKGEYTIKKTNKKDFGTDIELYLKNTEIDFLENWKIKNIVCKYSDHISIPIEIQEYDEKNKVFFWKQINKAKALWRIPKSEITDNEYQDFYKNLSKSNDEPLSWIHNKVEGTQEYISLLYIPKKSDWNIWNFDSIKNGLKLYIKKTYIMDDANQFLPNYLRFIKGIIDTNNLPINISREILQENNVTKILKKSLTKRILTLIKNLSVEKKEKYKIFWKEFGLIFKEGIAEDIENKNQIAELLRFSSIQSNGKEQELSLQEYVNNMSKNQTKIYFLTAENYHTANTSPHLGIYRKNNINVLLLYDKIDDWMMNYLTEFKEIKFQSINKIDDDFEKTFNTSYKKENITEEMQEFLKKIRIVLKNEIKSVQYSNKLIDTPCALITEKDAMSTQMSKLFLAAGKKIPPLQYILEINPMHPLITKIISNQNDKNINTWIKILFDQSLLAEKGSLDNPNIFIKNINQIFMHQ